MSVPCSVVTIFRSRCDLSICFASHAVAAWGMRTVEWRVIRILRTGVGGWGWGVGPGGAGPPGGGGPPPRASRPRGVPPRRSHPASRLSHLEVDFETTSPVASRSAGSPPRSLPADPAPEAALRASPPPLDIPPRRAPGRAAPRSEEHTSELQSLAYLVCRLLLEKKKNTR